MGRDGKDFWSRRRAAVQAETEAEAAARRAEEEARLQDEIARTEAEKSDEEILKELDLPDPDGLQAGDDFSVFMRDAVPHRLRNRAMRRLWRSNPVLANLDGLVDHGEDYTDAATIVPGMSTAYEVGKGMFAHVARLAADKAAITEDDLVGASASHTQATPLDDEPAAENPNQHATEAQADAVFTDPEDVPSPPVSRRHMRFAFSDE
ncbi:Protein of unknown function [Salinihabitans flavidus]|uniref:DUF3306 domain-containing protein n=1 Tax=Salinihabitans flavidus TaxID=569882 RepID=A0A1H8PT16_9RHOB|nr:DUF3306 domain-containing protein [Salinihabitans flavidus]SEO44858.1 Protein of unknown function [Salinihabitans flavidus]